MLFINADHMQLNKLVNPAMFDMDKLRTIQGEKQYPDEIVARLKPWMQQHGPVLR